MACSKWIFLLHASSLKPLLSSSKKIEHLNKNFLENDSPKPTELKPCFRWIEAFLYKVEMIHVGLTLLVIIAMRIFLRKLLYQEIACFYKIESSDFSLKINFG